MSEQQTPKKKLFQGQLTGNISLKNSKTLPTAVKAKFLDVPEGKRRVFRATMFDAEGNPVVIQGKVYESENTQGLTARISLPIQFEVDLADAATTSSAKKDPNLLANALEKALL